MERAPEFKGIPRQSLLSRQTSNARTAFVKEEGGRSPELKPIPRPLPLLRQRSNARTNFIPELCPLDLDPKTFVRNWKGKDTFLEQEELMPDVVPFSGGSDSCEEGTPSSFSGAFHPQEPVDTDLMKTVYVPISQNESEGGGLVKSLSMNGAYIEDLSIRVAGLKPDQPVVTPRESLVEERSDTCVSHNKENAHLSRESDDRECVWDASLPPSGNVSPLSSIDSNGVATAMSIVNSSVSTYRSDAMTSDGMLSVDRNCESMKGSV